MTERPQKNSAERDALQKIRVGFPQHSVVRLPTERQRLVLTKTERILVEAVAAGVNSTASKAIMDQRLGEPIAQRTYEVHRSHALRANGVASMWRLRVLAGEEGIVSKVETDYQVSRRTKIDASEPHRTVKVMGDKYYFTRAHLRVLAFTVLGLTQEQIAMRLSTSERSVTGRTIEAQYKEMRQNNAKRLRSKDHDRDAVLELGLVALEHGWLNARFIESLYDREAAAKMAKKYR